MAIPLMPKATAVWLVDNTSLTFDQIATFTAIHPLEIKAIADGENAQGIKGMDPISTGQLTREELKIAQEKPDHKLKLAPPKVIIPSQRRKAPRYTPLSKRQDRPNAILWLVRHHPELKDSQVIRLVGTTKNTIEAIRSRTHWNSANLQPMDPVTLGLCTQISLDAEVTKAAKWKPAEPEPVEGEATDSLLPAEQTQEYSFDTSPVVKEEPAVINADDVFANFGSSDDAEEEKAEETTEETIEEAAEENSEENSEETK